MLHSQDVQEKIELFLYRAKTQFNYMEGFKEGFLHALHSATMYHVSYSYFLLLIEEMGKLPQYDSPIDFDDFEEEDDGSNMDSRIPAAILAVLFGDDWAPRKSILVNSKGDTLFSKLGLDVQSESNFIDETFGFHLPSLS